MKRRERFSDQKVLVIGAGISGRSAADYLTARNAEVSVYDDDETKLKEVANTGGNLIEESDCEYDFCVVSPGISIKHESVQNFLNSGKPVISELELGLSEKHKKIIAITGTNGKTTVSTMIYYALRNSINPFIRKAVLCGNVGIPITSVSEKLRRKTTVVEVSSFQLESTKTLKPDIAVITNITQDHLDRHGTMEEYIRCKSAIFRKQTEKDILILNYDDENCRKLAFIAKSRVLWFSTNSRVQGVYIENNDVMLNLKRRAKKICSVNAFGEEKLHGIENILATVLVCRLIHIGKHAIIESCKPSGSLNHRLQFVGSHHTSSGTIMFYNDSKATNIASTIAACRCFKSSVNLILGGVAKGQDFSELFKKLPGIVDHIFVFGQAADIISAAAREANYTAITQATDLREAVTVAVNNGKSSRVVILSPACSSFDMFENYEHRGEVFVQIVKEIINRS